MKNLDKGQCLVFDKQGKALLVNHVGFKLKKDVEKNPVCYKFFEDGGNKNLTTLFNFDDFIGVCLGYNVKETVNKEYEIHFRDKERTHLTLKANTYFLLNADKPKNKKYFEFYGFYGGSEGSYYIVGIFNFDYVSYITAPNKVRYLNKT